MKRSHAVEIEARSQLPKAAEPPAVPVSLAVTHTLHGTLKNVIGGRRIPARVMSAENTLENSFWNLSPRKSTKRTPPPVSKLSDFHSRNCPRGDSNPHAVKHRLLRPACLPVPPPGHTSNYRLAALARVVRLLPHRRSARLNSKRKKKRSKWERTDVQTCFAAARGTYYARVKVNGKQK